MKMTDMVGFCITLAVHQDLSHSKSDTTDTTERYWLTMQQMTMYHVHVTNPKACE
jgi:hypothetical protein